MGEKYGRGVDLLQLRFGHGPISVQMNLQHIQALALFPLLKLFICGVSQRVAVGTIIKVFGVTRTSGLEPKTSRSLSKYSNPTL